MVSEIEARACRHSFTSQTDYSWGRTLGPLMVWAAFFVVMIIGGALAPTSSPQVAAYLDRAAE